jgi:homoserine O-succinyltransferase
MPIVLRRDAPDLWSDPDLHALDPAVAACQDVRPLRIILLNHAADPVDGDLRIARLLSNSPIQVELTVIRDPSASDHDISPYLLHFYRSLGEVREQSFDALVVVGPAQSRPGTKDVRALEAGVAELSAALAGTCAALYIGGAALDALRRLHGVASQRLPSRTRGTRWHYRTGTPSPLLHGHDHVFAVPIIDPEGVQAADITRDHGLEIVAHSDQVGVHILRHQQQRQTFILNDITLDADALGLGRRVDTPPRSDDRDGDHGALPLRPQGWSAHAQLVIANWLTHDVLPVTLPVRHGSESTPTVQVAGRAVVHPNRVADRTPLPL